MTHISPIAALVLSAAQAASGPHGGMHYLAPPPLTLVHMERLADRKAPMPTQSERSRSYLWIKGEEPQRCYVESWLIELFSLKQGQEIPQEKCDEINEWKRKYQRR